LDHKTEIWAAVLSRLESLFDAHLFESWIKPLSIKEVDGNVVIISAPSKLIKNWVSSNYLNTIEKEVIAVKKDVIAIEIVLGETLNELPSPAALIKEKDAYTGEYNCQSAEFFKARLSGKYRFDNYTTGQPNLIAFNSAKEFTDCLSEDINTLYIHGGVGNGKTHLAQAVAKEIAADNKKVLYLTVEKFMFCFIKALREKTIIDFKENIRAVDVLVIDDVHFICGKANIQEEFFYSINSILENEGKVVLVADRSPSELDGIEEKLKSRMYSGLVCEIEKPDYELRLNFLKNRLAEKSVNIDNQVIEFLAENISSNIRELEGALKKLINHAKFGNQYINIEYAMEALKNELRGSKTELSISDIKKRVSNKFSISLKDLDSARRSRNIARPRQIAMYLAKTMTKKSLPEIGRNFGGKDHATVIHAVKTVEKLMVEQPEIENNIQSLIKTLKN
jgi:chromosomal replication initiator protein